MTPPVSSPMPSPEITAPAAHVEWVPFRTAPGITDAELLAAADRLHREFLMTTPGYVRRSLLRDTHGGYVDCVIWRSAADHEGAMADAMKHPAAQAFFACLADAEAAGAAMQHFAILQEWR